MPWLAFWSRRLHAKTSSQANHLSVRVAFLYPAVLYRTPILQVLGGGSNQLITPFFSVCSLGCWALGPQLPCSSWVFGAALLVRLVLCSLITTSYFPILRLLFVCSLSLGGEGSFFGRGEGVLIFSAENAGDARGSGAQAPYRILFVFLFSPFLWQKGKELENGGRKQRITSKEYHRLLNNFEMEGLMAQKGLWNLAKEKTMKERGELPNEEGDVVRECKAMHEEDFWSSWLREDEKSKEEGKPEAEGKGEEERSEKEKEENETVTVKKKMCGFGFCGSL